MIRIERMRRERMENEVLLTKEGFKQYEEELEYLKTVRRQEIAEQIKIARGFGDLSENADYDEAKNEQAQVEARILVLENMLENAKIIEESKIKKDVVSAGSTIILKDPNNYEFEYTIVGSAEADPLKGRISNESPVGKACLGAKVGDTISVEAPGGMIEYKLESIK